MSKLRRNKENSTHVPGHQSKISKFFQGCAGRTNGTISSQSGNMSSTGAVRQQSDASIGLDGADCVLVGSLSEPSISMPTGNDLSGDAKFNDHSTNPIDSERIPNTPVTPGSSSDDQCVLNSSDIIPDTPVSSSTSTDRKRFQARSFLTNISSAAEIGFPNQKKIEERKLAKTNSQNSRLKQPARNQSVPKCGTNSSLENAALSELSNGFLSLPACMIASATASTSKRTLDCSTPAPKRADVKVTPKKINDNAVHRGSNSSVSQQQLFNSCAVTETKPKVPAWQILESCRTSCKPAGRRSNDARLDIDCDADLMDVLSELHVDSQQPTTEKSKKLNVQLNKLNAAEKECRHNKNSIVTETEQSNTVVSDPPVTSCNDRNSGGNCAPSEVTLSPEDSDLESVLLELRMDSYCSTPREMKQQSSKESETGGNCLEPSRTVKLEASAVVLDQISHLLNSQPVMNEKVSLETPTDIGNDVDEESQSAVESPTPFFHQFGRHKVVDVKKTSNEVVLKLVSCTSSAVKSVVLDGFWRDSAVDVGDTVNVIGEFDADDSCHVTDAQNFVVVEPDLLISGTSVVSAIHCMRRAVLNEKFKGRDGQNQFMLFGSILHAIFQQIMQTKSFSPENIDDIVNKTIRQIEFVHGMYTIGLSEAEVRAEVAKYRSQIASFVQRHCNVGMKSSPNQGDVGSTFSDIHISDVVDIEENIWSPRFGIKGKIDLTVNVKRHTKNGIGRKVSAEVLPLELKTGKPTFSAEHKGQVTLYAMMCAERRQEVEVGILLYLKDLSMQMVPANYANRRGLIQLRNEMAYYINRSGSQQPSTEADRWTFGSLPEPINNERTCSKCPQLLTCALYQRVEGWTPTTRGHAMSGLVPATLSHLSDSHLEYFRRWCLLLHLEYAVEAKKRDNNGPAGIWLLTGAEREKNGECISCLSLATAKCTQLNADDRFSLVFVRHRSRLTNCTAALSNIGPRISDTVIVSAENKPLIAIATACIVDINDDSVTVITDRQLSQYSDAEDTVYRLDRCNTYNSIGGHLTNMAQLMDNSPSSNRLRDLIIDKAVPGFVPTLSKSVIEKVKDITKKLNKPQRFAVLKVLMSKDYVLIKGFPGTGKTSTIVALIRILVRNGQSVLLTSYTHSAVDNILLKLQQHPDVDFIRLGKLERIHPSLHNSTDAVLTRNVTSVEQLSELYASKPVVATTCLGVNHAIFSRRTFDVCILDEASQVSLPSGLGPLFSCRRFVLIGDSKQLGPVVQSHEARTAGMDESLFVRLENSGASCELPVQYRMNSAIMRLSNELVYDGALQCASDDLCNARLQLSREDCAHKWPEPYTWLGRCISCQQGDEVLWVDVDPLLTDGAKWRAQFEATSAVQSQLEATLTHCIVHELVKAGVDCSEIGVITPYQQQLRLLRDTFQHTNGALLSGIEVNTVDQYQGRDKSVIVISFVKHDKSSNRSNGERSNYEILSDERRLNVAMTRARHKLIFIGSVLSLSTYTPLCRLLKDILYSDQIIAVDDIPADCQRSSTSATNGSVQMP